MEEDIFLSRNDDQQMIKAFEKAQETFGYFWRELSWEYRRIIPALDIASVKVALIEGEDEDVFVEHVWMSDIDFDGNTIYGTLNNQPQYISAYNQGDRIEMPFEQVSDWLFVSGGKSYGGFTVQVLRSQMNDEERQQHDEAWGVDFGDYNTIYVAYGQEENEQVLKEHPMSINMKEKLEEFINNYPNEISEMDEKGNTMLHREALAGNATVVEVLLKAGANKTIKNKAGQTPLDFAKKFNWEGVIQLLENK
ncbi:DUF2314 domain-containing protein [Ornithobacterium rhinotracheale]|uniref:DUF2314 domain-containing protein n=2 Tax=Ornithobacterium rhinotracheale TaxID=28251 RepID=UPI001FF63A40|nr:DUF2314 domain-containing protein [Ornithobacterium rhinotracheale]MCK0203181.1 DUF2314 domain-containing protein [Ornithobacterium rhinotracheale]